MFKKRSQNHHDTDAAEREAKVRLLRESIGPLSGRSFKFCTDACLRRYLEARNWNTSKAQKMLEETLKWRAEYKPEEIRWHQVEHEGETGKAYKANFCDRQGRVVLILRPGKQNTNSHEGNIRHLVYRMENAILNLPEGQGQMTWLIDFSGWSLNNNIPIKTAREITNILQNHYPERLAIAILYNPPKFFEAFWKVVKIFVDQKTHQKLRFIYPNSKDSQEIMMSLFDKENLPKEFGGKATLEYDHEESSRLMAQDDVKTAMFWGLDSDEANGKHKSPAPPAT
ncbi:uncharacterized protein LOC127248723 isoform X2 [Andrographis paniculata]|nr:uncharacterized protein LOC127248723 isoform X2 [Andrographis paniculata]XP_051127191.1 uncharacterized protein LOC127248723 isoform X2 [Andrographis paniculata]